MEQELNLHREMVLSKENEIMKSLQQIQADISKFQNCHKEIARLRIE